MAMRVSSVDNNARRSGLLGRKRKPHAEDQGNHKMLPSRRHDPTWLFSGSGDPATQVAPLLLDLLDSWKQSTNSHLPIFTSSQSTERSRAQHGARRPLAPAGRTGTAGTASSGQQDLEDMEERPTEPNASVDSSASPSVAQLAGQFREQAAAAKETPANKPSRRKPPCSLPLFPPKVELGQNGEEKASSNASHPPKVKVKSSPLIEKLQANLTFDPAALLPGASPKSPGLKALVSPFHSPPSTPSSPGVRLRPSEAEEVPVSFDQPPEGSHLPCYNKVRTRGSIKRRPPSRRFRRSQSDCGDLRDFEATESSQENGTRENGDEVFPPKSQALGSPPSHGGVLGSGVPVGKPPLRRTSSSTEKQEDRASGSPAQEGTPETPQTSSLEEAEGAHAHPIEDKAAGEEAEQGKSAEANRVDKEGSPSQKSQDAKAEEGTQEEETQTPPGGVEGSSVPTKEEGKEKQAPGAAQGCSPRTSNATPEPSSDIQSGPAVPTAGEDSAAAPGLQRGPHPREGLTDSLLAQSSPAEGAGEPMSGRWGGAGPRREG
ncbi:capZ-interacting protein [Erethizon dorsatum]